MNSASSSAAAERFPDGGLSPVRLPGVVVSNQSLGPADHAAWRDIHSPFIARPEFDAHHQMVFVLIIYNRLFSLDRIKAQDPVPQNDEIFTHRGGLSGQVCRYVQGSAIGMRLAKLARNLIERRDPAERSRLPRPCRRAYEGSAVPIHWAGQHEAGTDLAGFR
jgi:hypothetical protein